jgi:outer membrane receptor for monomeric catechols
MTIERKGIYLQDHLSVTYKVILSAGLRYDEITIDRRSASGQTAADEDALTPQAGISTAHWTSSASIPTIPNRSAPIPA